MDHIVSHLNTSLQPYDLPYFFMIHVNFILSFTHTFLKWYIPFSFSN
jgi:hypothetical protein